MENVQSWFILIQSEARRQILQQFFFILTFFFKMYINLNQNIKKKSECFILSFNLKYFLLFSFRQKPNMNSQPLLL